MDFNEYQEKALETALHSPKHKIIYAALGLGNEAGEVLGKVKKWIRGDDGDGPMKEERKQVIKEELGDVLWYVAVLAKELDFELEDIARLNVEKLQSRKVRGVLLGDGDKR